MRGRRRGGGGTDDAAFEVVTLSRKRLRVELDLLRVLSRCVGREGGHGELLDGRVEREDQGQRVQRRLRQGVKSQLSGSITRRNQGPAP